MTEKTPGELQAQRAQLIASTGLTEEVLRERAETFQLYPEHMDVWRTVEGIDYLLGGAEKDGALKEAEALAARRDAALQIHLTALRRAVETLPSKCMYHDDTTPHGSWREACCDTGIPARRRALAEQALNALEKETAA